MTKENAHSIAATMEQANERKVFGETVFSHNKSTIPTARAQGPIERLLLHGQENAQSAAALAKLAGMRSTRELRLQVARERAAGALILSSCRDGNSGYFLPADGLAGRLELNSFVASMMSRGTRCFVAAQAARQALQQIEGQTNLWEDGA